MPTQQHRVAWAVPAGIAFAFAVAAGPSPACADVPAQLTRVGNPVWRPVDFNLFAAPADTTEAFLGVADALLGPPDTPTDPPYDNLFSDGLAAAGIASRSVFTPSDIDGQPSGVYYVYTLVPDPGTVGSSFDFASGPIIPNGLFPLSDDTDLVRQGLVVDPEFDGDIPPLAGFDGYSHSSTFLASHGGFFPPSTELTGDFAYRSVLRDAAGNGWDIVVPFQVVPEPAMLAPVFLPLLLASRRRGRRARAG